MEFEIHASGNAPWLYPTDTIFGLLWYSDDEALEVPKKIPFCGEWGEALSTVLTLRETFPIPNKLNLLWLSIIEEQFYEVESVIPTNTLESLFEIKDEDGEQLYSHIVVGMAPYGQTVIWVYGIAKSSIISWHQGNIVEVDFKKYLPTCNLDSVHEYCEHFINNDERVRTNLVENGLPARDLFDRYMRQFCYRYLVMFERWDEDEERWVKPELDEEGQPVDGKPIPVFDFIEEALWDGTHDKLHDGGLMSYHQAGKPKKLALEWHIKKSQYSAYMWFEDELIRDVFEKFYGAHRDTKVDFIIRIDAEKNKYELALYRYGLQEPVVISEDAYQMIVFKSKFEYYRSENYDQPRGSWIW